MKQTIQQLKQLAEECITFAKSINQECSHSDLFPELSIYISSSDTSTASVTFFSSDNRKSITVTLYSDKIQFPMDYELEGLQRVHDEFRAKFEAFKSADLSEIINKNDISKIDRINRLERELNLLKQSQNLVA